MKHRLTLFALLTALTLVGCGDKKPSSEPVGPSGPGSESHPVTPSGGSDSSSEPGGEGLDVVGLGEALAESPYADRSLSGNSGFGLADPGIVGVRSDEESLIPEKPDSDYQGSRVIDFEAIDLAAAKEFFPTLEELDDYHAAVTCFKKAEALSDGEARIKIKFPSRTLNIDCALMETTRLFEFSGLKKVDVVGHGTKFNFRYTNLNWKGFFGLDQAEDITIRGVEMYAEMPSSVVGQITAMDVNAKTSTVKIDPVYNPLVKKLLTNHKRICEYLEFDVRTQVPLMGGNFLDLASLRDYEISGDEDNGYSITVSFNTGIARSRNNTYVSIGFSEYDVSAVSITDSSDIVMEDFIIRNATGMGIVVKNTTNLELNRIQIAVAEGSHDLVTTTADGLHFAEVHGKVSVTNSLIERTHDDALNIKHGYWYRVMGADNTTKTLNLSKITETISTPKPGQKVAIYDEDTFDAHNPTAGYYTINSVETTSNGFDLIVKERMSGVNDWGNCRATVLTDPPEFVFRNNIVRTKRNRGILVQVPNAVVENNTFENVGHGSIQAATSLDRFNEATIPQNLTVRNNKFLNNLYLPGEPLPGDLSVFAIAKEGVVAPKGTVHDITIENNFFTGNGNAALSFRGVGNATVSDNFFYECCKNINSDALNCILNAYNAGPVTVSGNYSHYTLDKGMSGIILQGLSTESDFALNGNTAIDFYHSSSVGPNVDIAKATGSLTFDGNLSDWASVGATDIDMIAASLATGDEISFEAIKNQFKINAAKMVHTDEGIAMAFDVYDNVRDVKPAASFWTGDCIEILMTELLDTPSADMQVYKNSGGVLQIAFAPTWTASNYATIASARSNANYLGKERQLSVGCADDGERYTMEFLLPYAVFPEFKTAVEEGKRIGIAVVVADSEREDLGRVRVQAGNVPHFVESFKTKSEMMPRYLFK